MLELSLLWLLLIIIKPLSRRRQVVCSQDSWILILKSPVHILFLFQMQSGNKPLELVSKPPSPRLLPQRFPWLHVWTTTGTSQLSSLALVLSPSVPCLTNKESNVSKVSQLISNGAGIWTLYPSYLENNKQKNKAQQRKTISNWSLKPSL